MKVDLKRIEQLFDHTEPSNETMPQWAKELMQEIRSLKQTVASLQRIPAVKPEEKRHDRSYYDFVKTLRSTLMPNPIDNDYPEVKLDERRLGITNQGLLYDKSTGSTLSREDAFNAYKALYRIHRHTPLF